MFALGNKNEGDRGSTLVLVIVLLTVVGLYAGFELQRFKLILKSQKSTEIARTRRAWGRAISDRIDCERVMVPYTRTNKCPAGTTRNLTFYAEAPLTPGLPDGSFSLGHDWFAKVSCGVTDLKIQLAKYSNGSFIKDPLTGQTLDFGQPSAVISDGGDNVPVCPGYFEDDTPNVRMLGMSVATLQRACASTAGPNQTLHWIAYGCDGTLGMLADMDNHPLEAIYRDGGASGPSNVLNGYSQHVYDWLAAVLKTWGVIDPPQGDIQPDWLLNPDHGRVTNNTCCNHICRAQGYGSGVPTKCDGSFSASPLMAFVWDNLAQGQQVNCLCIR